LSNNYDNLFDLELDLPIFMLYLVSAP